MAELIPRSLGATLIAAASSFALFAAANWKEGYAPLTTDPQLPTVPWLGQAFYLITSMFQPWYPFLATVQNALRIRIMRTRLHAEGVNPDPGTLSIITLCPIFIQIPDSYDVDEERASLALAHHGFKVANNLQGTCPLQLSPRSSADNLPCTCGAAGQSNRRGVRYIHLRQACASLVGGNSIFNSVPQSMAERKALMVAELEPEYEQLSYMRARSRFQALVTALQAAGYMLSVAQRLVQHLEISPLEALIAFYSVLTFCQLVTELYACGHYQQPLLLRLTSPQFTRFLNTLTRNPVYNMPWHFKVVSIVLGILATLLAAIPTYLFLMHYRNLECDLCARTALSFLVASGLSIVPLTVFILVAQRDANHGWSIFIECMYTLSSMASSVAVGASLVSFVLAIVATIKSWELFKMVRIGDWFAWVLPHVSS